MTRTVRLERGTRRAHLLRCFADTVSATHPIIMQRELSIPTAGAILRADLRLVEDARGLVLFAHGSGSGRKSARNRRVARTLEQHGLATVLLDLLTAAEADADAIDARFRFDIPLLARRLGEATDDIVQHEALRQLPIGYFGASTGAAAALIAAAERPNIVHAVVSRGGRPDLARDALAAVQAPTLLIVGGADTTVLRLNEAALRQLTPRAELAIIPGASHLFGEPGALDQAASMAANWFMRHLADGARPDGNGGQTTHAAPAVRGA
jgi:pimeloyl-ACP methyl ester carboxylesterase